MLILGWDGADWDILNDLRARGCLPGISSLVEEGVWGTLESVVPTHSWAAWPTFLTGKDPSGHGVFDFVERDSVEPLKRIPATSKSIKATTFLEYLSEAGRELRVGNVPVAFPPIPINGRMISGVAVPPGAEYVHPPAWRRQELDRRAPFPVNGLEWARFGDNPQGLIDEARDLLERRTASFEVLLEGTWDVAVCIYVETDRLQHAFGAYLLPSHPDHQHLEGSELAEGIRDLYRQLDAHTARLIRAAGPNTTTVLMSDHGFRPITHQLNLNELLKHLGFAGGSRGAGATSAVRKSSLARKLKKTRLGHSLRTRVRVPSALDWSRTLAYWSTTGGGVSLNLKGREPEGVVEMKDYERVRDEVRTALLGFEDPETETWPIAKVIAREELYDGPHLNLAPDLFVQAQHLWSMSGGSKGHSITSHTTWPTGRHRRAGVVIAHGDQITPGELATRGLADLAPTALSFCGLRVEGLDGQSIEEVARTRGDEVVVKAGTGTDRTSEELSKEEQEQITNHLRDLGYIE